MPKLLKIWQSSTFKNVNFWIFQHVNNLLRNTPISVSNADIKKM